MPAGDVSRVVSFGAYEVDVEKVEIRRSGRVVPVQPQVFAVIEYLISERDRVVSKEDLLDNVWGDRFVSESAVTSRIKSARKALGDSGVEQQVIRTVLGRGYRFVAEVEAEPPATIEAATGAAVSPALPAERSDDWPLVGRRTELASVAALVEDRTVPGVCVTGPEHIGATRFVESARAEAESAGLRAIRVVGLRSARTIPLAALSHVVPDGILATEQLTDDLARAEIVRRARRFLEELAGDGRLIVQIENAEHLDAMTTTVLITTMLDGSTFGLSVRSQLAGVDDFDSAGVLRDLALRRLREIDIDTLLHRVLEAPISPATLNEITDMSNGRPGLVRDIVETSMSAGSLVRDHGVWRLRGRLSSTARSSWDPTELSAAGVRGAEILSLVGRLAESDAISLFGDAVLEELDEMHLLALEAGPEGHHVSLVDPLLAAVVRESISPLRERRIKSDLTAELLRPGADPRIIAVLASWQPQTQANFDDGLLLVAAQTAMIVGDIATAGELVLSIADRTQPPVQLIEAEVALRHSQWSRAEELFEAIDIGALDDISGAHALRRRAAIQFYSHSRFEETIDWLEAEAERRGGRAARALRARRVGMLAYLGRSDDALREAADLGDMHGLTAIEVLLSSGSASLHRGDFERTVSLMDEVDVLLEQVPEAWADEPRDAVVTIRCSGLLHLGQIEAAAELARASLPIGERTPLGYFPSLAASIELAAGRPRAAREMVRQAIQTSHRAAFPQYLSVAEAVFATTDLALGHTANAAAGLAKARRDLQLVSGELHWLLSMMIAELAAGLGEPPELGLLIDLADEAQSVGAVMREADLLVTAALLDRTGRTAQSVVDRIEARVEPFPGRYWPLRASHVRALADARPFDTIVAGYLDLGFGGLAP